MEDDDDDEDDEDDENNVEESKDEKEEDDVDNQMEESVKEDTEEKNDDDKSSELNLDSLDIDKIENLSVEDNNTIEENELKDKYYNMTVKELRDEYKNVFSIDAKSRMRKEDLINELTNNR